LKDFWQRRRKTIKQSLEKKAFQEGINVTTPLFQCSDLQNRSCYQVLRVRLIAYKSQQVLKRGCPDADIDSGLNQI
jgi:hypothetical protein